MGLGRSPGAQQRHAPVQRYHTRRPVRVPEEAYQPQGTANKGYGPRYDDGHPTVKSTQYGDFPYFKNQNRPQVSNKRSEGRRYDQRSPEISSEDPIGPQRCAKRSFATRCCPHGRREEGEHEVGKFRPHGPGTMFGESTRPLRTL